ncbi:gastrula zinc finger protein XlCGF26.1 isoform X33 [Plutella xylostella]|uniref:gastrula zinc finger protein XlCGF26.1 isoform X33 n=1 Tax=Plutella xylostella TaxID=51655 RepID=UPI0020326E85|nr:gastrula zinc finger protein XlCGF26.1 isoform X33 [Plutella xylostella]
MDVGKSSSWPPGPTVCRCCLAEGCYKDISTEYFWMGKREVYAEMLTETFDLAISYAQSAGTNSNSRLICEPCISRLRDASEFKRQVSECERMFTTLLEPGSSGQSGMAQVTLSRLGKDVKVERVKVKKEDSEDDDDDDMFAEPFGDDDDDDDADDEPLTNLATKIPKKEAEDDIFGSEDKPKPAEKRKATVKAKAVPAKKAKATVTKAKGPAAKVAKPQEKKKRDIKERSLKHGAARQNAEHIVKYTTACPYRLDGDTICCVYCFDSFTDPSMHRQHINDEHETFDVKIAFANLNANSYLRVDCTDLKCRLCLVPFQNIKAVVEHLHSSHELEVIVDAGIALLPNKYEDEKLLCGYCNINLPGFRQLSNHVTTHYQALICELCGKSFMTKPGLLLHTEFNHRGKGYPCAKCKQKFQTRDARKEHVTNSRQCWVHTCRKCNDRFLTWKLKQNHVVSVHSGPVKTYPCTECGEVFPTQIRYYIHFKLHHSSEVFVCNHCGTKYYSKTRLEDHMVSHTKEKKYKCSKCSKCYPYLRGLTRHLTSHHKN